MGRGREKRGRGRGRVSRDGEKSNGARSPSVAGHFFASFFTPTRSRRCRTRDCSEFFDVLNLFLPSRAFFYPGPFNVPDTDRGRYSVANAGKRMLFIVAAGKCIFWEILRFRNCGGYELDVTVFLGVIWSWFVGWV